MARERDSSARGSRQEEVVELWVLLMAEIRPTA